MTVVHTSSFNGEGGGGGGEGGKVREKQESGECQAYLI